MFESNAFHGDLSKLSQRITAITEGKLIPQNRHAECYGFGSISAALTSRILRHPRREALNRPDTRLQQVGCRLPRDVTARPPWLAGVPSFFGTLIHKLLGYYSIGRTPRGPCCGSVAV